MNAKDEALHGKAFQATDDDVNLIIADLNRFYLFAELRISSGLLYQDSSLAQDTNTYINDDYDLDIFNGELVSTHNSTEITQMLQSACKKTDHSENESTFELCIHTFINDVNNLFIFAQLDIENVVQIKNSLVERDDTVPCQETSLPPTAQCGIAADNIALTIGFHPFGHYKYKLVVKDGNGNNCKG